MNQKCIFCGVVKKELKSFIVYDDKFFLAFLDIKPLFVGHCLLVPKQHIRTIYDLPYVEGSALLRATQNVGNAITAAMNAEGTFIAMNNKVSQSIDHLHVHIVPRNKGDGLKGFFWPRTEYQNEAQIVAVQLAIKKAVEIESDVL